MKKILKVMMATLVVFGTLQLMACGPKTPADKFVDVINSATSKVESAKSMSDINNLSKYLNEEVDEKYFEENKDYELTSSDKNNIKNAMEKLLTVTFKKTLEINGYEGKLDSQMESQLKMVVDQMNSKIDNCKTLGDLNKVSF